MKTNQRHERVGKSHVSFRGQEHLGGRTGRLSRHSLIPSTASCWTRFTVTPPSSPRSEASSEPASGSALSEDQVFFKKEVSE